MTQASSRGEIITFYSYKGGTGRTMALANVACLLASNERGRVLVVDWDLEAPGLHRFFAPYLLKSFGEKRTGFDDQPGLMELLSDARGVLARDRLADFIIETDVTGLDLMKAGQFNDSYPVKVSSFDWEDLFHRDPAIFRDLAEALASRYGYVLIDSRTGISDASGICTTLLPERLVLVFTPNLQSLTGLKDLISRAIRYRRESDDLRPLVAFPLPSRVELTVEALRDRWRFGEVDGKRHGPSPTAAAMADVHPGYQPLFNDLFREVYALPECDLGPYFDEVQIQHVPEYAYGEEIAVLTEKRRDRLSLTRSYRFFTDRLINWATPWSGREEEALYNSTQEQAERIQLIRSQLQLQRELLTADRWRLVLGLTGLALAIAATTFEAVRTSAFRGVISLLAPLIGVAAGVLLRPIYKRVIEGNYRLNGLRRALLEETTASTIRSSLRSDRTADTGPPG